MPSLYCLTYPLNSILHHLHVCSSKGFEIPEQLVLSARSRLNGQFAEGWRAKSRVVSKGVARIVLAINADWMCQVKHQDFNEVLTLTRVLEFLAQMAAPFADDPHASWVSGPIFRLLNCILLRIAAWLIHGENGSWSKKQRRDMMQAVAVCRGLLDNIRMSSVGLELARETIDSLDGLLSEWKQEAIIAAGTLVVGAVKSIATWKVDESLIKGFSRGISAGWSYYKQLKGKERLLLLCEVSPSMSGIGESPQFKELVSLTTKVSKSEGNWIVESSWVMELHRNASRTLDLLELLSMQEQGNKDTQDEDEATMEQEELNEVRQNLLKCLAAVLGSDRNVKGLTRMVTSIRKPMKAGSKAYVFVGALLDCDSLLNCGRQAADELMGEIEESMRTCWLAKIGEFSRTDWQRELDKAMTKDLELAESLLRDSQARRSTSYDSIKKAHSGIKEGFEKFTFRVLPLIQGLESVIQTSIDHLKYAEDHTRNMSETLKSAYAYHKLLGLDAATNFFSGSRAGLMPFEPEAGATRNAADASNQCTPQSPCKFCERWSECRSSCNDPLELFDEGVAAISEVVRTEMTDFVLSDTKRDAVLKLQEATGIRALHDEGISALSAFSSERTEKWQKLLLARRNERSSGFVCFSVAILPFLSARIIDAPMVWSCIALSHRLQGFKR